jgi:hypothetical protein
VAGGYNSPVPFDKVGTVFSDFDNAARQFGRASVSGVGFLILPRSAPAGNYRDLLQTFAQLLSLPEVSPDISNDITCAY